MFVTVISPGAYLLAREFDVVLSIETMFSDSSHTYIKLHTDPEYILDFWSSMVCRYQDTTTWYEVMGDSYRRNKDTEYKTELTLNSKQLLEMGDRVFTEKNWLLRTAILDKVNKKVSQLQESTPRHFENQPLEFDVSQY